MPKNFKCPYADKQNTEIAILKEQNDSIKKSIESIKDNHLQHIYNEIETLSKEISGLKIRLAYWAGGVGAVIVLMEIILKIFSFT